MVRRRVTLSKTQGEEDLTTTGSSSPSSGDDQHHLIPPAKWTFNKNGVPQAVAHRGYKAEFPENTMGAFRGAVAVGAQAIETDVHLSKDDVVVIAHVSTHRFRSIQQVPQSNGLRIVGPFSSGLDQ